MFSRKISVVFKYGVLGSVAIGSAAVGIKYYKDYDSIALVRILRTGYTAFDIGRTYRSALYSKEWDTTSNEYLEVRSKTHKVAAEKLLELCKANKGVYIKVGQHIGALDYFLPNEYVMTMRILHKDAPQNSVEDLYKVIREDLKKEPKEMFEEFDPEPLGTASLAQVHKAKLKNGSEVAVKVQHHYVKKNINIDLWWMEIVLNIMTKVFPEFEMNWLIDETKKNINKELNFLEEGRNAEKVANLFRHYKWLKVPKIYWDFSSERVLTMEYVTGGQVNDIKYMHEHHIDKFDLCKKLGDLYSHMIFVTGFVHSDPHPGNILVSKKPDEKEVSVYLLDHGLYANLTEEFRYNYSKFWLAMLARNSEEMKFYSEKLGIRKELYALFACMVSARPWETIQKGIVQTKPSSQEKELFQNELPKFFHYVTQCLEHVDRQALLVLKTNDLIRSIESALRIQHTMSGFMVMSKCCLESVYKIEYKRANSSLQRQCLNIKYGWSMFTLYIYSVFLNLVDRYNNIEPSISISSSNVHVV